MEWSGAISYITYTLGSILCVICAVWVATKGDAARTDRMPAIVALALTANWCFAAASFQPQSLIVGLTEVARNIAWIFALFRHFANDGRDETLRMVRPAIIALCFVEALQLVLMFLASRGALDPEPALLLFDTAALFRLLVAIGALVLLHNLYVGAAATSRQLLRWNVGAMVGLWAFDLNYYTVSYILGAVPEELIALRGLAAGLAAVPFALGYNRVAAGLEFRPSRAVTFRFLSLLVIGIYLGLMMALARWLDMLTGDLARLAQVGLVIAAGTLAIIWLPSTKMRGWLRVTAVKHLFKHRYDYRNEWMRFTHTIGQAGVSEISLAERAVKALADITESPSGLLFLRDDNGDLELAADWRWTEERPASPKLSKDLVNILETREFIIDFDELRAGTDQFGEQALIPDWLRQDRNAWAAIPLLHFERMIGLIVLARPAVPRKLDWEDFDLMSVVSRQLASYLAEQASQAALMEAGRFDEFNRRMAFVMHDIKNLSSQMSLLLRNAEKHADKPEFREDMLVTLRNSAEKLNVLLARLGRYGSRDASIREPIELSNLARKLAKRFGRQHPVAVLRSEPSIILAEQEGLEQALVHLVQNAIDASEPNSSVVLEVYPDGLNGKFQVIDSGTGMSPQFLRSGLFKPFVSSKEGGFGIGAFEAREMIHGMGGRLGVESREGIGTRFTISFPLQAASELMRGSTNKTDCEDA